MRGRNEQHAGDETTIGLWRDISLSPTLPRMTDEEDRTWQRLDKWLWCARFLKARAACARLVAEGSVRINRQPTDKPHARLRPGDVLTLPVGTGGVRVVQVLALAARRGPAPEARSLYAERVEPPAGVACTADESSAYRPT